MPEDPGKSLEEPALARLPDLYEQIKAMFTEGEESIRRLVADPRDQDALKAAVQIMEMMRDGLEQAVELRRHITKTRGSGVAALYAAGRKAISVREIGDAAGCNDSYVSRIAKEHGLEPRTNRQGGGS